MTLTTERTVSGTDDPTDEPYVEAPPPFIARYGPRTILAWIAVSIVVIGLAFVIVEDPVAHVWFEARQHQLGAQTGLRGRIPTGHQVGVLTISVPASGTGQPARFEKLFVIQGDGTAQLRGAPGHAPQSALLGARGNSVIFGHRRHWGAPFALLDAVPVGAQIQAQSVNGTEAVVYTVKSTHVEPAGDPLALQSSSDFPLTLVTAADDGRWYVVTAISGAAESPPHHPSVVRSPSASSPVDNGSFPGLVLALLGLALVIVGLRRRFSPATIAIMAAPLVLAGLLAVVLELDLLYAPLA